MAARQSLKYGVAAVAIAIVIIAASLVANPIIAPTSTKTSQSQQGSPGNFVVLLTDPPDVPSGTTQLNLTYSGLALQVIFPNGTSKWVSVKASGTVDLLVLVNVTQTIASTNIPAGSTVERIQFSISSVSATINGQIFPVTTLSNQLIVSISNRGNTTQTSSGALLQLNPTLVQIRASNSTGGSVNYYVLVPSATAIIKPSVSQEQAKVGAKTKLETRDMDDLAHAERGVSKNVTITSATLTVSGTTTKLTITLKNQGSTNATIFGLTLHGQFNATRTCPSTTSTTSKTTTTTASSTTTTTSTSRSTTTTTTTTTERGHGNTTSRTSTTTTTFSTTHGESGGQSKGACKNKEMEHPDTIPFKFNGTSLVPLLGDSEDEGIGKVSSITLKPGQSITLSFSGVIQLNTEGEGHSPQVAITPVTGTAYTIRLMGEGFQTIQVKAA